MKSEKNDAVPGATLAQAMSTSDWQVPAARVARLDAFPIAVPFAKPLLIGGRRVELSTSLLVRVITDDGAEGWGEAVPDTAHGDRLESMVTECQEVVAPVLCSTGLSGRSEQLAKLAKSGLCSPRSLAAVEIALGDALARQAGVRFCDLWGGAERQSVRQKWLLGGTSVDQDLADAEALYAQGITCYHIKVGSKSLKDDIKLAHLLRTRFGAGVKLSADANEAWTVTKACSFLRQTEDVGLVTLEQPLPMNDLAGTAEIAALTDTPICIDQGLSDTNDILRYFKAGAIGGAVLKPSKFGGMRRVVAAGTLCDALGIRVAIATPLAETSVGTAAALHLAAILPEVEWDLGPSADYLAEDIVVEPIRHKHGHLHVPVGLGLGVDVDQQKVERLRLNR